MRLSRGCVTPDLITWLRLNSTLSVRIEELQAQISTLYVENLRLRASEIALAAQLKKEQEKSRKILADAEAAVINLFFVTVASCSDTAVLCRQDIKSLQTPRVSQAIIWDIF